MTLELTPAERVIIANQCRILEKLYPEESDFYARWRNAIESGYQMDYDDGAPWLDSGLPARECQEVWDILKMFDQMMFAYDLLQDKSGIEPYSVQFHGFDGNNECAHLGYADHIINKMDRFQRLKDCGDSLNSHSQVLDTYRRMLEVWRPMEGRQLTKEQIVAITTAAIHPSHRKAENRGV
jgi:uncharacterized protein